MVTFRIGSARAIWARGGIRLCHAHVTVTIDKLWFQ